MKRKNRFPLRDYAVREQRILTTYAVCQLKRWKRYRGEGVWRGERGLRHAENDTKLTG